MISYEVSWLGVIAAAVVSIILGFLWYGPLFGKKWMSLMKFSEKDMKKAKEKGMGKTYFVMIVSTLIGAYLLGIFVNFANSMMEAVLIVILAWLAFVATTSLSSVLWEGKSVKLYLLNNAYYIINYILMALVIYYL